MTLNGRQWRTNKRLAPAQSPIVRTNPVRLKEKRDQDGERRSMMEMIRWYAVSAAVDCEYCTRTFRHLTNSAKLVSIQARTELNPCSKSSNLLLFYICNNLLSCLKPPISLHPSPTELWDPFQHSSPPSLRPLQQGQACRCGSSVSQSRWLLRLWAWAWACS